MISLHSQPLAFIKPARNLKAIRYLVSTDSAFQRLKATDSASLNTTPRPYPKFNDLNLTNWKPIWGQIQSKTATITNQFNEKHILSQKKKKKQFSKNINQKNNTEFLVMPGFLFHHFTPF